ncbi:MAG: tetratricopeptide repeat protein [Spirirestis rafaelensis WJT71-NPBG6]|jgi:tetratricopeptide (TPR) repeat protein|nr:tetratricopeptide repeat protein [Spirirestis rafaelensis WJT71-NPBG6]
MISSTPIKKILILAANPKQTSRLRLDEEVRDIKEGLRLSQQRDTFILQQEWAVRPRDVRRAVLDFRPNIIHFSGHGAGSTGLSFEDETGKEKLVTAQALAGLFEQLANQLECVLLNACYSEEQAVAIAQHIDYVIGMNAPIGDKAAKVFAVGFYDALARYNSQDDKGSAIEFAFNIACNAIELDGVSGESIPVLKKKPNLIESVDKTDTFEQQISEKNKHTYSLSAVEAYRKKVEEFACDGKISDIERHILSDYIKELEITDEQAYAIEAEALKPYLEYQENLKNYLRRFVEALNHESHFSEQTRDKFKHMQQTWKLKSEDLDKIYNSLGNALYDAQDNDKAILAYKEATLINNNNPVTHRNLGNVLLIQNKTQEAIAEYREAIRIEPNDARLHFHLGNIFYNLDLNEAIYEYKKAVAIEPEEADFHNRLGRALSQQDNFDEAITEYKKAIELNPNLAEAHGGLGIALYRQRNLKEAIASLLQAIYIESDNAVFYRDLGRILYSQGKLKEAVAQLKEAILFNRNDAFAYAYLGFALLSQRKQEDGIERLKIAIYLLKEERMTQEAFQIEQILQQVVQGNRNWMNFVKRCLVW